METAAVSYQLSAKQKYKHVKSRKYNRHKNNVYNLSSAVGGSTQKHTIFIMMSALLVVSIVLSGNTALAAQRDSFKAKYPNSISHNVNSISNAISDGSGSEAGNENINTVGHGSHNSESMVPTRVNGTTLNVTLLRTTSSSRNVATTVSSIQSSGSTMKSLTSGVTSSQKTINSINFASNRNTIDTSDNSPYFDRSVSKNVTALLGKTAYLNCRVKNLGNKTMLLQVSWVRHRDIHLLTVGRYTYTSDQRFRAIHQPQTEDWMLQIKYPQHRDSGIYECQVSTTPHMSHYIYLNVVEPSTEIIGAPDLYIESGSTINLTCVILNSPEPPAYIFWNHNNAIINYDSPRGGVTVVTNKGETTTSFLLIKSARPSDSGHYQCNPSNAKPKGVTVHVLNGEFPAAMQRADQAHHRMSPIQYILVYLLMYLFTLMYISQYVRHPFLGGIKPATI